MAPLNWPRPELQPVRAYNRDSPAVAVSLADNTNGFGTPPSALAAVRAADDQALVRYPTTYSTPLREALAGYLGVEPGEIMVGCGSQEVLDCAFRAFATPGTTVAHVAPTFIMAPVYALVNHLRPVAVPLTPAFDADAEALLGADAGITYLCSPNNPTGALHSSIAIERVLANAGGLVILDEAYAEYSGTSHASRAPAHGRLLVLRTFSKAFGLAGLRVGYGVGAASLIAELEKVRGPFKVTSLADRAALAALEHDVGWMRTVVAETVAGRDEFITALRAAGRTPLPSDANFVLVPVVDALAAADILLSNGIHVRAFPGVPDVGDALRISIGPPDVMQRVLDCLSRIA